MCDQECGHIHGMFLLSPVDGADPYGIIDETCITPPKKLNFQVPALIVSGGLDSQPGLGGGLGGLWPACAPEDLSNERSVSGTHQMSDVFMLTDVFSDFTRL